MHNNLCSSRLDVRYDVLSRFSSHAISNKTTLVGKEVKQVTNLYEIERCCITINKTGNLGMLLAFSTLRVEEEEEGTSSSLLDLFILSMEIEGTSARRVSF